MNTDSVQAVDSAAGTPGMSLAAVEVLIEPQELIEPQGVETSSSDAASPAAAKLVDERPWTLRILHRLRTWTVFVAGGISLIVGLATLATIPGLNLLSLGYLLEASGRVGRTGKLSAGFIGIRPAAALGAVTFAFWLARWPVLLVAELWNASRLIDPASAATRGWAAGWLALVIALAAATVAAGGFALYCKPALWGRARDGLWRLTGRLVFHYWWLGLRGFVGSFAWLVLPVTVLAAASFARPEAGALLSLIGGLMLFAVVLYLPLLQVNFAVQNRLAAMFQVRTVRQLFNRAPVAFGTAFAVTLLMALPLYLLMIELLPREVTWLPSVLFVVFLFPARLLSGWAYARAKRRELPRLWLFRWSAKLGLLPVAFFYVLLVFFSQYLSWYGVVSLYHQHAFLMPVPFLGG